MTLADAAPAGKHEHWSGFQTKNGCESPPMLVFGRLAS